MSSIRWDAEIAEVYDETYDAMFQAPVLGPMIDLLAELAGDGPVGQVAWSHHWIAARGGLVRHSAPYRYVWPSELDLMGKLTGFRLRGRWAGWARTPFTADSQSQVAVFEKLAG